MTEGYWHLVKAVWNTIDTDGVELFLVTYRAAPLRFALCRTFLPVRGVQWRILAVFL